MENIVIIGNGVAANSAAETIRQYDPNCNLVMMAREEVPAYSACALPDCMAGWVDRSRLFIKQWQDYTRLKIDLRLGREITSIDSSRQIVISNREEVPYDKLIIATGSRAFIPPVAGSHLPGNFVVKSLKDMDAIIDHQPDKAVVIGSGNIGVEVAEALQIRGCQVNLLELRERILPRILDDEPARRMARILIKNGIKVFTGEKVLQINGREKVEGISSDCRDLPCDTIIWAAGVKQNVEIALAAGVEIGSLGGIKVNSQMQTNVAGIYACGDCVESVDLLTGRPTLSLLWPNAKRQGQVAALNCLGRERQAEYEGATSMVVEEIYGTTMIAIGMISENLTEENLQVLEHQDDKHYWRVLMVNDCIMGMQSIGITSGLGAMMALMKSRTPVSQFRRIVDDPVLSRKAAWYLPARQFLGNIGNRK